MSLHHPQPSRLSRISPGSDAGARAAGYGELAQQLGALLEGEPDMTASLANAAALLNEALEDVNWVGFYLVRSELQHGEPVLVLGPFQGRVACTRIPLGRGVCGTSAARREAVLVDDVHEFPGHIACDAASRSELVLPLVVDDTLVGVLDIDSPSLARFDALDSDGIGQFVDVLTHHLQVR